MPTPLSLIASKGQRVGKAIASAAKPVTDSMCTNESLLSRRINAIERLGELQFLINGFILSKEKSDEAEETFDELKKFYLQSRSFFNKKVSTLLLYYMAICRQMYLTKEDGSEQLEAIMEDLEFELRCSVSSLPAHIWLRLKHYHLAAPLVILLMIILGLYLYKELAPIMGEPC